MMEGDSIQPNILYVDCVYGGGGLYTASIL